MLKVKPKSYKQKIKVSTWNQNGLLSNILEDSNRKFQMVTGLILKLCINLQWYLSFVCFFNAWQSVKYALLSIYNHRIGQSYKN